MSLAVVPAQIDITPVDDIADDDIPLFADVSDIPMTMTYTLTTYLFLLADDDEPIVWKPEDV